MVVVMIKGWHCHNMFRTKLGSHNMLVVVVMMVMVTMVEIMRMIVEVVALGISKRVDRRGIRNTG